MKVSSYTYIQKTKTKKNEKTTYDKLYKKQESCLEIGSDTLKKADLASNPLLLVFKDF
jgi:hypothetical protein